MCVHKMHHQRKERKKTMYIHIFNQNLTHTHTQISSRTQKQTEASSQRKRKVYMLYIDYAQQKLYAIKEGRRDKKRKPLHFNHTYICIVVCMYVCMYMCRWVWRIGGRGCFILLLWVGRGEKRAQKRRFNSNLG